MRVVRKQQMACLSLIVLMILPWESAKFADGSSRFNKFASAPSTNQLHNDIQSHKQGFFKGNAERKASSSDQSDDVGDGGVVDDDDLLEEKRRIRTGPNPLHNR